MQEFWKSEYFFVNSAEVIDLCKENSWNNRSLMPKWIDLKLKKYSSFTFKKKNFKVKDHEKSQFTIE